MIQITDVQRVNEETLTTVHRRQIYMENKQRALSVVTSKV